MSSSTISFEEPFYEEKKYRILKVLENRMMTARQIKDAYIEEFGKSTQSETQEEIEEMVESGLLEEEYSYSHFRKLFYSKISQS